MPRARTPKKKRRDNGAGALIPLKKNGKLTGKIRVEFKLTNGVTGEPKAVSRIAHSDLDAGRIAAELRAELDHKYPNGVWWPEPEPDEAIPGTVSALVQEWFNATKQKRGPKTNEFYQANIRYIRGQLGHIPIRDLTHQQVTKFLDELVSVNKSEPVPLKAGTKNRIRSTLSQAYEWKIARDESLTANPAAMSEIQKPDHDEDDAEPRWFTEVEARRFFDAVRRLDAEKADERFTVWLAAAWMLQYNCGLRPGEVRALAWSDLSLDDEPATVEVLTGQKRASGETIVRGKTKTKESRRKLSMRETLREELLRHRDLQAKQRAEYAHDATWNPHDLVFVRADGTPIPKETYNREFGKVCKAAGIITEDGKPDASPYALRHSFVTHLLNKGVPITKVAAACGHGSIRMVVNIYSHLNRATVDELPDLLATV
jgi:integrase